MYLTRRHLSRRTVLRGMGASIALPLLDAMVPAATAVAKTAAAARPYLGFFYLPHGQIMDHWTPAAIGRDFEMKGILEPLAPHRKHLTVVSNLDNEPSMGPATHAITPGTWLSCVPPRQTPSPFGGITIDQMAVPYLGQDTPLPSLELATEASGGTAACTGTYGCSFGKTISFRSPTHPLPVENTLSKVFEQLFGQGDTPQERKAIAREAGSVIDMVLEDAADLQRKLGPADRARIDDYLETVREIERRIGKAESHDLSQVSLPELPAGIPTFEEHLKLMFEMITIAYQANLTRIVTFMMAAEVSNQAYTHLGIQSAFHPLSHHNNAPEKLEQLVRLQTWHAKMFGSFLDGLARTPGGEGSLLDDAIFLYGGNMRDSSRHDHIKLPSLVVGGGCGRIKGGQHLSYPDKTPHANLLVTLLDRAQVPIEKVGDSTGLLSEI
jgi:hypothetical protein